MRKLLVPCLIIIIPIILSAQKVPLDHTVYDGWKSFGANSITKWNRVHLK